MSIDSHFIHRCDTQRPETTNDAYNNSKTQWPIWLSGVRCRLVIKSQRVADSVLAENPIITTYKLFVSAYTDVKEGDRIVNVVDETGTNSYGPFRVGQVLPRRGKAQKHIALELERIR